ncbi:MAG: NAD(P)-dependent oxidoreductase [Hyphomicrobiales bacterium]|nr:NAD(P)-dependent oxidoreductase [Hyphomicrobiales bacterium]
MKHIGIIGLGAMGLGMAKTLVERGFTVRGCDLSSERQRLAQQAGVTIAAEPSSLYAVCELVVASLPKAADVAAVVEGPAGFIARGRPDAVFVDTSTSEPKMSRKLAAACGTRLGFLDAPVSGGPQGAKTGTLTFMVGGDKEVMERARPVLTALGNKIIHVGASGAGNVAKLVNNLLVAANLASVREAVALAAAAGVPAEDVLTAINAASGRSAVTEVNYTRWILSERFDSGFTMGLMRKDVKLAAKLGQDVGSFGAVSALVSQLWDASTQDLGDDEDFNKFVVAAGTSE